MPRRKISSAAASCASAVVERLRRRARHGGQQVARELAADRRRDLGHLLDRGQPVEAGHQRVVQRRRDRQRRQRAREIANGRPPSSRPLSSTALVSSSRNSGTPSALATIWSQHRRRAGPCRRRSRSTMAALWRAPNRSRDKRGDVRVAAPRLLELRPEGDDQQHRQPLDAVDRRDRTARGWSGRSSARPRAASARAAGRPGRPAARARSPAAWPCAPAAPSAEAGS